MAIGRALAAAQEKPDGGWFVVDATRVLSRLRGPKRYEVADRELVAWTANGVVQVAPGACPHMGADLASGRVAGGCLVCPWHGLNLRAGRSAHGHREHEPREHGQREWAPHRVHHDGVLTWVQLDPTAPGASPAPALPLRPTEYLDGVVRREAVCEPADILANRLDPWHGAHFHPYAFARLQVTHYSDDALHLRVAYKVVPGYSIEVGARFDCPDARTIVMTITEGEGSGSVVETHATPMRSYNSPLGPGPNTAIVEATLGTSDRAGFVHARRGTALARPIIKLMASRLWRDDARYAERTYELRRRKLEALASELDRR